MTTIQGKGVSAGVGIGSLYYYHRESAEMETYEVTDTEAEWRRFKNAQAKAVEQLGELAEKTKAEVGEKEAVLFRAHQMLAESLTCEETVERIMKEEKLNAETAVLRAADVFAEKFASMDDAYMRERAADKIFEAI